jgi:hypothetical protein
MKFLEEAMLSLSLLVNLLNPFLFPSVVVADVTPKKLVVVTTKRLQRRQLVVVTESLVSKYKCLKYVLFL